jgi:antitoxin VapB
MATALVFMSGRSQAVRLPKEFRFACDEGEISREGDALVLRPIQRGAWVNLLAATEGFDEE